MIAPVDGTDFRTAHHHLERPLAVALDLDDFKIDKLVLDHTLLCRRLSGLDDHAGVHELVVQLMWACAGLDMLPGDLDCRLALAVTDIWLERNGYLVLPSERDRLRLFEILLSAPKSPQPPTEAQVDNVRHWAHRNIAVARTGTTLGELVRPADRVRPVHCFMACPLTGVSPNELDRIRELCDRTASLLSEYDVLTFQPALYTSANATTLVVDDPAYRAIDEHLVAQSDMVLVIAVRPSIGLGVVASYAQRYRKRLLFATDSDSVTPLVTGMAPRPTLLRLRDLESELRHHLDDHMVAIEATASTTQRLIVAIDEVLEELRKRLHKIPRHELARRTTNPARVVELVRHPELFAGATALEVWEIYALLGA